mmetsp:Transcript_33191/g.80303  ORF Transcript_33191/g.80303 Transcript_33191/m.80303 type:complete len:295 (-) Transcript_33191:30-914(-)
MAAFFPSSLVLTRFNACLSIFSHFFIFISHCLQSWQLIFSLSPHSSQWSRLVLHSFKSIGNNGYELLRNFFYGLGRVNDMPWHPPMLLINGLEFRKTFSHADLQVSLFISFASIASPFLCCILIQIQKYDGIGRRQSYIWRNTPRRCQFPSRHRRSILHALGARECHAAVSVPVADDVRSPCQRVDELGRCLPSVGAEQKVNGAVVRLDGRLKIFVDQTADLCGPIRKTIRNSCKRKREKVLNKQRHLGGLATSIDAFEEDEGSSLWCGGYAARCDHGHGHCFFFSEICAVISQ